MMSGCRYKRVSICKCVAVAKRVCVPQWMGCFGVQLLECGADQVDAVNSNRATVNIFIT